MLRLYASRVGMRTWKGRARPLIPSGRGNKPLDGTTVGVGAGGPCASVNTPVVELTYRAIPVAAPSRNVPRADPPGAAVFAGLEVKPCEKESSPVRWRSLGTRRFSA